MIMRLEREGYYTFKDKGTGRLYTNITSIKNEFFDVIKKDNDLVTLDLSNSQFAIFCHDFAKWHPLAMERDFIEFKEAADKGLLYELIQDKLNLPNRAVAKKIMFEINFASHKLQSDLKKQLKKHFPSVVSMTDEYKRYSGPNSSPCTSNSWKAGCSSTTSIRPSKRKRCYVLQNMIRLRSGDRTAKGQCR